MTMNPKTAAYYVGVSQHPFDNAGPGNLVTGMAIAYAIVVLGLVAKLVLSSGTPGWAAQSPVKSSPMSIAIDLASARTDLPPGESDGSGYIEFEAPADPHSAPGFSQASTAKQAHESGKPAGAQRNHSVARTHAFKGD